MDDQPEEIGLPPFPALLVSAADNGPVWPCGCRQTVPVFDVGTVCRTCHQWMSWYIQLREVCLYAIHVAVLRR
jgi:hypothetical protein